MILLSKISVTIFVMNTEKYVVETGGGELCVCKCFESLLIKLEFTTKTSNK